MTANDLSKKFLLWFQQNNPDARIYRNNAGCFKTLAGSWVRYGIPNVGSPDYIAFIPKVFDDPWTAQSEKVLTVQFFEIKTLKDKMSKDQIKFADMVTGMGGNYYIVREKIKVEYEVIPDDNLVFYIEKWIVK